MLKFIHKAKLRGGNTLTNQMSLLKKNEILDEIINNAIELPIESQDLLLMIAKGMRFTKDCMLKNNKIS